MAGSSKVDRLYAALLAAADSDGIVGNIPREHLAAIIRCVPSALASQLSELVALHRLRILENGNRERIGRYAIIEIARPGTATKPVAASDAPFTSPDLAALGIEVVTRLRAQVSFCSPTGLPQLVAVSLPRLRFLEGTA